MDTKFDVQSSSIDFSGVNSYVKRITWNYISTKYQNLDKTSQELIYNSVILELSDTTNYEDLYKNIQVDDENQRLSIINSYLAKLVPPIIERLAFQKNIAAKNATVAAVRKKLKPSSLRFDGRSILDSFKSSKIDLPTGDSSYSESPSAYSQLLREKYRSELRKYGNPRVTDLDFKVKTDKAIEETNLYQKDILQYINKSPKIFDPKTHQFHDFERSVINQRISAYVADGIVRSHGEIERKNLIDAIIKGDFKFYDTFHISAPEFPTAAEVFPALRILAKNVKKTLSGDVEIESDPLAEFVEYTDTIKGDSDAVMIEKQERDTLATYISVGLSEKALDFKPDKDATLSEGVNGLDIVIGFSEAISNFKNRYSKEELVERAKLLDVKEGEFSVPSIIESADFAESGVASQSAQGPTASQSKDGTIQVIKDAKISETQTTLSEGKETSAKESATKESATKESATKESATKESATSKEPSVQDKDETASSLKPFKVSASVITEALTYAITQSANGKKLNTLDQETLEKLRAQVLAISGEMGLGFSSEEELKSYVQAIRNLKSDELFSFFKKYSKEVASPELKSRLALLQAKLSLELSNIYEDKLDSTTKTQRKNLIASLGSKLFFTSAGMILKVHEARETLKFLRKLKKDGIIPTLGAKKLDILIRGSHAIGLKDVAELLERYKKVKEYHHLVQIISKSIKSLISVNKAKISKATNLLKSATNYRGAKLFKTRRALRTSRVSISRLPVLQFDVLRSFRKFFTSKKFVNIFLSKSRSNPEKAKRALSLILEKIKKTSSLFFSREIKRLERYSAAKKLFSGVARFGLSILKRFIPVVKIATSKVVVSLTKVFSKVSLKFLKPLLIAATGAAKKLSKSGVGSAAKLGAYKVSKILGHKAIVLAAKTTAKVALGAFTGGVGLVLFTVVEFVGIKRTFYILVSIIVGIITAILILMYLIFSSIIATFNSSNSESTREGNIYYTFGTISGSSLTLNFLAGFLDSTDCSEQVQSWGGGRYGSDYWDNLNKRDFVNIRITNKNCRVVCNMARAMAGLQPSRFGGVKGVNCNPNYYNGVIDAIPHSRPFDLDIAGFGYYACNYLTYSAYSTPGSVVDPVLDIGQVTWYERLRYHYCNSTPLDIPGAYPSGWDATVRVMAINGACAAWGNAAPPGQYPPRMLRYTMVPMKTQTSSPIPLCVPRDLINPGDVIYWGKSCPFGPDSGGDAIDHTGLVLELVGNTLITIEANNDTKKRSFAVSDCQAQVNGNPVPGVMLQGSSICRLFIYNPDDPNCPTDGSAYQCPDIISGTPGFMR